jgi:hypothetical protein
MSLEENVPEAPKVRRRPGPKPGAKKRRHDPEPAPIDGDYQPLDVVGKEPGFEYFALSNHDRQRRGHQFEVVRWSEKCAHSPWEVFSEELRGKEVKINGQLTLMRAPKERVEARRKRERDAYRAQSQAITAEAKGRGFDVTESIMPTHTINVSGAY